MRGGVGYYLGMNVRKYPKYRPQTKHLSIKWNYFIDHIKQGTSNIFYVEKNEQQSDIMKKPLAKPQFEYLRKKIMGW